MRRARLAAVPAVAVLGLALAACSGGASSDQLPDRLQSITPTDSPPASFAPPSHRPMGFRTVTGDGFELSVPANWTDRKLPSSQKNGVPGVEADQGGDPARPAKVAVIVDTNPVSGAIEQSEVLAVAKTSSGVSDLKRSTVKWPGTERGILITWTEKQAGTGQEYRIEQLMAQVSPTRIVNIVGKAPVDVYASAGVDRIVRTLVITS